MQTTMTIAELAGQAYDQFQRKTRENDESYVTLKDDAPDWLNDLVHEAHGDFLPDDWRYETIRAALGHIHDTDAETADDLDDDLHEFADSNVDTYTAARTAWLASNLNRAGYCDEAASEFGFEVTQDRGVLDMIALGQYAESSEVFESVRQSLADRLDELESENES